MAKKGIIYKIELADEIYVGSTTHQLCRRQSKHNYDLKKYPERKLYKKCIEQNITYIKCIWVKDIEYNSIEEMRMIEEQFRKDLNGTLNSYKCYTTEEEKVEYYKEYNKNNKELVKARKKSYYEKNREKVNARKREIIKCNKCGTEVTRSSLSTHQKTQKCKSFKQESTENNQEEVEL